MPIRSRVPAALAALLLAAIASLALPAVAAAQQPAPPPAADSGALARADALWLERARGAQGGWASLATAKEVVAAYEAALREAPQSLEAHWKLMRALWYQGDMATRDAAAKQAIYARGRDVGEKAFALLETRAGAGLGGRRLADLEPKARAAAVKAIPEALPIHFWAAVNWGLWGEAFGKLAAARQGVGTKIRDLCEVVIALDERAEEAGGHRVLGRLHSEAPHIPFVTGWVDRDVAVRELRRGLELAPESRAARVWLAEALRDHFPERRAEAETLLQWVAASTPRPDQPVEDTRFIETAKRLLAAR